MSRQEMAEQMRHRVIFTKEGNNWTVVAPDLHAAHSWGPNLESATEHIKEAIALVLDLPDGAEETMILDAEYRVEGLEDIDPSVFRQARESRNGLREAQEMADETLKRAVAEGRRLRLSVRDIATMTGVSYQRVAQIASGR